MRNPCFQGLTKSQQQNRVFFFLIFIYFFGCTGSSFLHSAFSGCGEQGLLSSCVQRLLTVVASPVAEHGLNCSKAHGIFLDWLSNLCPLHWQADS